jgi:hypothetical protein
MNSKHAAIPVALALAVVPLVLGFSEAPRATFSNCELVLEQEVCTWVTMEGDKAVELGATVPLGLIEGVPGDAEMTWPPEELGAVMLPVEARTALGIDHLAINWEAHGHPPGPFLTPHFDFHFYNLTKQEVSAVSCMDETKPQHLPSGYALPDIDIEGLGMLLGLCVPRMGMHAMPEADIEATGPFGATMVVGYYGGEGIFFEPMVSRDLLLERSSFRLPIPTIGSLPAGVHYPSEFSAEYDATKDEYRMVMRGFDSQ